MVSDLPIEVYFVPAMEGSLKYRIDLFERVVRGRASAFSPFLLNVRDTHFDSEGGYYLITERFDGTDLGVPLAQGKRFHVFGTLCLAFQVCLALHELHGVGVIQGGLAPRCIRLNRTQTSCKITDFEFATPLAFVKRTVDKLEGYLNIMPPERFSGSPVSVQQDMYQVGNLILRLICGKTAVSASQALADPSAQSMDVEDPNFRTHLLGELSSALETNIDAFSSGSEWLDDRVRETSTRSFLTEELLPILTWCLAHRPDERPKSCLELLTAFKSFGVPPIGHITDPHGAPITGSLFTLSTEPS
jgi:serine/threonine protein kinase